jgi:hypothetical protein
MCLVNAEGRQTDYNLKGSKKYLTSNRSSFFRERNFRLLLFPNIWTLPRFGRTYWLYVYAEVVCSTFQKNRRAERCHRPVFAYKYNGWMM